MCDRDNKGGGGGYGSQRFLGGVERLIGGTPTDRSYHPWFTQLKVTTGPTSAFACGGTIIDDEWIITSTKHCCISASNRIDAMIGGGNWIEGANKYNGEYSVASKKVYTSVGGTDTCLIHVDNIRRAKPYSCNNCYAKACLPTSNQQIEHGMYCWVVGNPHNAFAELGVNIFSEQYCLKHSWLSKGDVDYRNEFCGGKADFDGDGYTDDGEGICGSDRGGPLICNSPSGTPTIMGIASRRSDPSTCASAGYPDIFINVPSVVSFVQGIMNSNSGY